MATLGTLESRVKNYLIDVPAATEGLITAWINKAVNDAEERYDFRYMEAELEATTVASPSPVRELVAKPDDWKRSRNPPWYLRDDGTTQEMAWAANATQMRRLFSEGDEEDDGDPQFLLETDSALLVYPFPDGNADYSDDEYRIHVPYWAYSEALSDSGDSNWLTQHAEWYVTYKAAAEGMIFNRDTDQATTMVELAEQQFQMAKREDKRSRQQQPRTLIPRRGVFGTSRRPPRHL